MEIFKKIKRKKTKIEDEKAIVRICSCCGFPVLPAIMVQEGFFTKVIGYSYHCVLCCNEWEVKI